MSTEPLLKILLISDSKPGHVSQSFGLINVIERIRPVEVTELVVSLRLKILRLLLRYAINKNSRWTTFLIEKSYGFEIKDSSGFHLIVSSGGDTSFASAALAREWGIPNFYLGSLRALKPELFSRIFTLDAVFDERGEMVPNNVLMPLLPSKGLSESDFQEAARLRESGAGNLVFTLVLGGDGVGYRYTDADWKNLADAMNFYSANNSARWLIITSRRSGTKVEEVLKSSLQSEYILESTYYSDSPQSNKVTCYAKASDLTFCSEDSMTMLNEALLAGARVIAISPEKVKSPHRYESKIHRLSQNKFIQRCSINSLKALQPKNLDTLAQPDLEEWNERFSDAVRRAITKLTYTDSTGCD